ncbi:hypothetical protein LINGRAHAP2_LOCUS6665 [Linum grandiflorum]
MRRSDWDAFHIWSRKWWGTQILERRLLSDDLWLLQMASKEEVTRVRTLGRWTFRDRKIVADGWFPFAGRSSVALERGVSWVKLDIIPLHLRSDSLLRQLGSFCGKVLEIDETGCTWNSVRIKIFSKGFLPRYIPVSFLTERFLISVTVEDSVNFCDGWRGAGSSVFIRKTTFRTPVASPAAASTEDPSPTVLEEGVVRTEQDCDGMHTVLEAIPRQEKTPATVDSDLCAIAGERETEDAKVDLEISPEKEASEAEPYLVGKDGIGSTTGESVEPFADVEESLEVLGNRDMAKEVSEDFSLGCSQGVCGPSLVGPIAQGISSPGELRKEREIDEMMVVDSVGPQARVSPSDFSDSPLILTEDEDLVFSNLARSFDNECDVLCRESATSDSNEEDRVSSEYGLEIGAEADGAAGSSDGEGAEVRRVSSLLASKLDLQIGGSRQESDRIISLVADEVLTKRNEAVAKSKKERELYPIRIDGSFSDSARTRLPRVRRGDTGHFESNDH